MAKRTARLLGQVRRTADKLTERLPEPIKAAVPKVLVRLKESRAARLLPQALRSRLPEDVGVTAGRRVRPSPPAPRTVRAAPEAHAGPKVKRGQKHR